MVQLLQIDWLKAIAPVTYTYVAVADDVCTS